MSEASYFGFVGVPIGTTSNDLERQLSPTGGANQFAPRQAIEFANPMSGFSFVAHLPNTSNGTSLAVFKSNIVDDGAYTISVRGTEPFAGVGTDILEDVFGIVLAGKAKVQLIEAFRYYKQITTPGGQAVVYTEPEVVAMAGVLYSGTPIAGIPESIGAAISAFYALASNDVGLGPSGQTLIPSGASINFTGHSLGGHVAYLLAQPR